MATQYTTILKLALPVQGELSGSWGDVVNNNITEMVEEAVAGLATINSWTANSHTLTSADGTTSESRCAILVADDDGAGSPSAAATIICPAASKLYVLKNISGQEVTLKTSAGTGVAVANGSTAFLFCDGTNVESCQTDIVGATTIDTTNLEVTNIKAKDGTSAGSIADSTGVVTIASAVLTTADINGGTIDGVTIGGASTAAGSFTTVTASGRVTFDELKGTDVTVVDTILDEDNMSSNSDTALATQQSIKAFVNSPIGGKGSDIASASSIDIGAATGQYVDITGTTTITALGTVAAGTARVLQFDDALTLTHNATSLILPGGANITTAAGDVAAFVSEGSGNWRCTNYQPASISLSTYEEGTYTPTVAGETTAGTAAYTTQSGNYVRIGSLVVCLGRIKLSSFSGPAGALQVGGLPFTIKNSANMLGINACTVNTYDMGAGRTAMGLQVQPGTTYAYLVACGDNVATEVAAATSINATADIRYTISYILE